LQQIRNIWRIFAALQPPALFQVDLATANLA